MLLPHNAGARTASKSITLGPLATVVLLVVVGAKLEAVVGATYKVPLAASVAVIAAAIPGPITLYLDSLYVTWRRLQAQRLRDS